MGLLLICSQLPEVLSLLFQNPFQPLIVENHGLHGGSFLYFLGELQLDPLVGLDNGCDFCKDVVVVFETELVLFVQVSEIEIGGGELLA